MTSLDPRLALTIFLEPEPGLGAGLPAWPALVSDRFGTPDLGSRDPMQRLLEGPLPHARLASGVRPGGRIVLSALGNLLALTAVAEQLGEWEQDPAASKLRGQAFSLLLSDDPEKGGALPIPEDPVADLEAQVPSGCGWRVAGISEWHLRLREGIPADLPDAGGWTEAGGVQIGRGVGVGGGHAAWDGTCWFIDRTGRTVGDRGLAALSGGYARKAPASVDYAGGAVRWARAMDTAVRRAGALDALFEEVAAAASWVVAGGALPGEEPPDLVRLAARLETLRVGLVESIETLADLMPGLRRAAERILGEGVVAREDGPFIEASAAGARAIERLRARDAAASRWAGALAAAREVWAG